MDCSLKINEKVHIGRSVRKTSGDNTIPYHNLPITNAKITKFDNQGFILSHPNFGRDVWLEFDQLPLMDIRIENGVILDEIVFVEHLFRAGGTQMCLQKTDTDEYRGLVEDKEFLDKTKELVKLKDLKPGQIVTPGTCKEGANFTFLGVFNIRSIDFKYAWRHKKYEYYINNNLKRALFMFDNGTGTLKVSDYPVSHKMIKELFDTGQVDKNYSSLNDNLNLLQVLGENNKNDNYGKFDISYSSILKTRSDKNNYVGRVRVEIKKITDEQIMETVKELQENYYADYKWPR